MTNEEVIKHLTYLKEWFVEGSEPYVSVDIALKTLEQEPFMHKLCVAHPTCHEDKIKMLDKIKADIQEYQSKQLALAINMNDFDRGMQIALDYVLAILYKYKSGSENKND